MLNPRTHIALLLGLLGGCGSQEPPGVPRAVQRGLAHGAPRHILLITVDTLRADALGCYGNERPTSPAVDALAAEGVRFAAASAPRGSTWPALTSLLSGAWPLSHGVRHNYMRLDRELRILPQYLRAAGYACGAFLANYSDAFPDPRRWGWDEFVAADRDRTRPQQLQDRDVVRAAALWLERQRGARAFTWVHFMAPHRPYDPGPDERQLVLSGEGGWLDDAVSLEELRAGVRSGAIPLDPEHLERFLAAPHWMGKGSYGELARRAGDRVGFDQLLDLVALWGVPLGAADLAYVRSRYDAEVRATDRRIGELLARVRDLGLDEQTLVVFTADHGEELYDHNRYFFHGSSIYAAVLQVPLVVRWPGKFAAGAEVAEIVGLVDLLPTVLELLDLAQEPAVDGESFLALLRGEEGGGRRYHYAEVFQRRLALEQGRRPPGDGIYSIRDGRWKLVANLSGHDPRTVPYQAIAGRGFRIEVEELYDLALDPREQRDLYRAEPRATDAAAERAAYLLAAVRARDRLHSELLRWIDAHRARAARALDAHLTSRARAQMAALGYVDGAPVARPAEESAARDLRAALLERAIALAADSRSPELAREARALLERH